MPSLTIAEYAWYEWVKFRDTSAKFPVSKIQLRRDLGAAIINTSGKAGTQIPHPPLGDDSPPGGDNPVSI
jgi:hypothetical protein